MTGRRWLRLLLGYLRARLALALHVSRAEAPRLVCAQAATISASALRVDVRFSLAALPIAVRLAGLDRDPGWLPAAGRDIRLHFE